MNSSTEPSSIPTIEACHERLSRIELETSELTLVENQLIDLESQANELRAKLGRELVKIQQPFRVYPAEVVELMQAREVRDQAEALGLVDTIELAYDTPKKLTKEHYVDLDSAASYTRITNWVVQKTTKLICIDTYGHEKDKETWLAGHELPKPLLINKGPTRNKVALESAQVGTWSQFKYKIEEVSAELITEMLIEEALELLNGQPVIVSGKYHDNIARTTRVPINEHQYLEIHAKYYAGDPRPAAVYICEFMNDARISVYSIDIRERTVHPEFASKLGVVKALVAQGQK